MAAMDKDEVIEFLHESGYYDPWKAEVRADGLGYWVHYSAGLVEESGSQWRPTLKWALRSARRGVQRRNDKRAVHTWTVEGDR